MKKSFLFRTIALALTACVAAAGHIVSAVAAVARFACDLVAKPLKLSLPRAGLLDLRAPALLMAARSYAQRLLRREYAHVDARWRMCPSV